MNAVVGEAAAFEEALRNSGGTAAIMNANLKVKLKRLPFQNHYSWMQKRCRSNGEEKAKK